MMTSDEAAALLVEKLGLTAAPGCGRIMAAAVAGGEGLPASWFEVYDRVWAIDPRSRGEPEAAGDDFALVYDRLNHAVNTDRVPFPREVG